MLPLPIFVFAVSVLTAALVPQAAEPKAEFGRVGGRSQKARRRRRLARESGSSAPGEEAEQGDPQGSEEGAGSGESSDALEAAMAEIDRMFMIEDVGDEVSSEMVDDDF